MIDRAMAAAFALWAVALGIGARELYLYATTQGELAALVRWPADTALHRTGDLTVLMFVHADCPCSRASLAELATLDARPIIVFGGSPEGATWDRAAQLPGATVVLDPDGREAARFGARTSGTTLVYDADGALRFSGGITESRGHVGDNVGRREVARLLAGHAALATHPVFGCALEPR